MCSHKVRIFYLDAVRVVALFCIILFHFNSEMLAIAPSRPLIGPNHFGPVSLGELGVGLFVILSGATLAIAYPGKITLKQFYKRRFLALFPLFWTAYIFAFLAKAILHHSLPFQNEMGAIWLTIIGMDGFLLYLGPNCYLVGEWFFGMIICLYALFPWLKPMVQMRPLASILLSFIWLTLLPFFYSHFFVMEIWRSPLVQICFFATGIAFAKLFEQNGRHFILLSALFLIALAVVLLVGEAHLLACFSIAAISFSLIALTSHAAEAFAPIAVIRFLGGLSFPAFLMHHVIILALLPPLATRMTLFEMRLLFAMIVVFSFCAGFIIDELARRTMQLLKRKDSSAPPMIRKYIEKHPRV